MPRSRLEISRSWTVFNAPPSPKRNQSSCREYKLLRDQKGTKAKRWIQNNVRFGPVSDINICNHKRRYSIEVQVQFLFKDQFESWIGIVNDIDKFVREVMPIEEKEKSSGKPAVKARPIFNSSSTSDKIFTFVKQRQWIDIATPESKDLHCFQVSKFISRLLRHSQQNRREEDTGVHYDKTIIEC